MDYKDWEMFSATIIERKDTGMNKMEFIRQLLEMEGIASEFAMAEMNDYEQADPCDCQDPALHQGRCRYATLDDCEWTTVKDALTDAIEAVETMSEALKEPATNN